VNVSLYQAAAALNANSEWQQVISENLASASVPGYKKQELTFDSIHSGLLATEKSSSETGLPHPVISTNFSSGEMRYTGVNTDVAIDGAGFFPVQMPNGTTSYTRNGEFHIDSKGQLVTNAGYAVQTDGGSATLDMNNPSTITISSTGVISQGTVRKGQLKLVEFNDPHLLTPVGGGFYEANNNQITTTNVAQPSVRQGFLEAANISPVTEMANLITVMRTFEANQKTIQLNDERMSRVISDIGNPS